jgi:carboxyl-terminal processing protease
MLGKSRLIIASAAVVILSALIASTFSQSVDPLAVYNDEENFKKLAQLYDILQENYFEEVNVGDIFSDAVNSILVDLDPHSVFIDYADYVRREEEYRGNYQGIGVTFVMLDDKITVTDVVTGGPSDRAGLKMGDRIVEIEGDSALGLENTEVQRRLRGPANSPVSVKIERPFHEQLIPVTITRGEIKIASVENIIMLDADTGYVRITRFAEPTSRELEQALLELESTGMKQLILDLRGNTGGLLETAFWTADKFLPGERLIVYTNGRTEDSHFPLYSRAGNRYWDVPLVVLIDHASASGSEIVAGALQDWDRAVIAGQTSFGKGLVQTNYILRDRSRLMLTTARYYTPSGRLIQREYQGVDIDTYQIEGLDDYDPNDVTVEDSPAELPLFKTAMGRPVYGGGGVTPDVMVEGEAVFDRMVYSFDYQLHMFLWTCDYYWKHPELQQRFEGYRLSYNNYDMRLRNQLLERYNTEFSVSEEMLRELLEFVKNRGFVFYTTQGEQLTEDELNRKYWELADQFRLYLKAEIAEFIFGRSAGFHLRRAVSNRDTQLARARQEFGNAAELLAHQTEIDPDVFSERRAVGGNR